DALDQCLTGQPLSYVIENKTIIITEKTLPSKRESREREEPPADTVRIRGKVTDDTGIGIPGVNVVIKGTTQGTISDYDGTYAIADVPDDAILVFSFVGKKSQE